MAGAAALAAVTRLPAASAVEPDSLGARGQRKGIFVGAAIDTTVFGDREMEAVLLREFSSVTPGYEMKWGMTEKERGRRDFERADGLLKFARQQGLHVRAHTLVWHANLPVWLKSALSESNAAQNFRSYVDETLRHFGRRIGDWDILNEVVDPEDGRPDDLRQSPWLQALGPGYPEEILRRARELMPEAELYYNDYGVEFETAWQKTRRAPILRFVERLMRAGAPLDGVGLQSHLFADGYEFNARNYRQFLREIAGFGLSIQLTELDCRDNMLPGDIALRDRAVADTTRRVLEVALDEPAVKGVTFWGIADPQSWLNLDPSRKRKDGLAARPLLFDADYRPKPVRHAVARAIDAAPSRQARSDPTGSVNPPGRDREPKRAQ